MPPVHDTDPDAPLFLLLPLISRLFAPDPARPQPHLTKAQILILLALASRGSLHMSQIASFLGSSKEQATRAVAPLADARLVERFAQPENRTKVFLRLTPDGMQQVENLHAQFSSQLRARARDALSEQDLQQLRASAETLIQLLSKLT